MHLDPAKKTLLRRLADRRFHSGTALAAELGMSRAAVWKHLQDLEALGLELAALPGRGYRAVTPLELLDAERLRAALSPAAAALLGGLDLHDVIDSTNTHLMQSAGSGLPTGTVCLAETQTAGRGRIGRDWLSPFGANLYLSLLWRFEEPSRVAGLSLAVGVAAARVLEDLGVADIGLKWPNDLLLGERKLGGILLEVAGEAHGTCVVVVGLGINRYLPARLGQAIDQPWADLSGSGGEPQVSRLALAAGLLNALLPLLAAYGDAGLAPLLPAWRRLHRLQGRAATLEQGGRPIHGRIVDVTEAGLLVMDCEEGGRRQFASGDVRLRAGAAA
jgi:BirA family biotin operon repressor/biotin-[acetyl-CoA-carboxylase] ligase